MANKSEIDTRWAGMAQRLEKDERLAKVIASLEGALKAADGDERHRLKVPYANAVPVSGSDAWE